jgi:hypothetical protein
MRERDYQASLIKKLRVLFPGCVILKNDSDYMPGVPDITILWKKYWGMLEVKVSGSAPSQPNQEYYVDELDKMSFAAFIYPENEEDVLHDLQQAFGARRQARVSQR